MIKYPMFVDAKTILLPSVVFLISLVIFLLIRGVLFRYLKKWLSLTPFKIDTLLLKSVKTSSVFWCIAAALYLALETSELHRSQYELINKTLVVLIIFSVSLAIANLLGRLFKTYVERLEIPIPTTGLFYGILKGAVIVTGLIVIMSFLGISIAPLLTALGVGGLAVALAFKDTLENLFAGIHILIEKTIRVGDFIRLESGQEGYVEDITWRTTRIKMIQNNMVIIPNSKLSQSIVLNYSLPEDKMSMPVAVSVSYDADPDFIERILIEEISRAKEEIQGLERDFEPVVRFNPGFGESSLDFTVICQIKHINLQVPILHELRKRILSRFKKEGVEIPFPHRVLYVRNESSKG